MIKVDKAIKLDPKHLNHLLDQISEIDDNDSEVIFDFSETKWISSELAVFLGAIAISLIDKGYIIKFSPMKKTIESVFSRNGFFKIHGLGEKVEDFNQTIIPYRIFQSSEYEKIDEYLIDDVFDKINEHVEEEKLEIVTSCIFEILHNIEEHSGSKKVLVCGQWYPQKKKLALAIADIGVSIPIKINDYLDNPLSNWEAVHWATNKGNSTKKIPDGGLGLYELKQSFIEHGQLKILSNNVLLCYNSVESLYSELNHPFPGTLLHLEFEIE